MKCAVIVSSCDKYEDVWSPFFHYFKRYWKKCPYPIYLNTETKTYEDSILKIRTINYDNASGTWSSRLKNALKHIDSEYIIFLLEDFFFLGPVNDEEINRCVHIMDSDKSIAVIDFEFTPRVPSINTEYEGYVERTDKAMYHLNCQSAIWRRKDLMRFLSKHENPWQFEIFGSERAKLYNRRFLLQKNDRKVFNYIFHVDSGFGLYRGKWLKSNEALFENEGIHVDFNRMGFYNGENIDTECPAPKKSLRWKLMYALYGGFDIHRKPLRQQVICMFRHPRMFAYAMIRKIRFVLSD